MSLPVSSVIVASRCNGEGSPFAKGVTGREKVSLGNGGSCICSVVPKVIMGAKGGGKLNGCMRIHRNSFASVCKRLCDILMGTGRTIRTKRPVNVDKDAKHDAKRRLRFRVRCGSGAVSPGPVLSCVGRMVEAIGKRVSRRVSGRLEHGWVGERS